MSSNVTKLHFEMCNELLIQIEMVMKTYQKSKASKHFQTLDSCDQKCKIIYKLELFGATFFGFTMNLRYCV